MKNQDTLRTVGLVGSVVLLAMTVGCAADQAVKPMPGGLERTDTPIQEVENLPTWVTQKGAAFSGERRVFYGVGNAAGIRNPAFRPCSGSERRGTTPSYVSQQSASFV